ncbi:hypothetical protein G9A89_015766 [Geosiphon pyriformis]|nr:hypothetical protein G9A89_015766 [Geosiphon pyriformis]
MMQLPIYQLPVYQTPLYQPAAPVIYQPQSQSSETGYTQNPSSQNYLSLLVTSENVSSNNLETNQKSLISNILPATVIENESLAAIFPFKIEELSVTSLFSRAALEEKPITTMYTNAKVDDHTIKLILDSCRVDCAASARIITADGVTKTPISKIDNFFFKVNSIITPIKVLVMKTMQYQALVGNDWLVKTNKLQLSQNSQHTRVPITCEHFKLITMSSAPLIKFEKEKEKPTWEAYQRQTVKHLDGYSHNDDKIWQIALAKIKGVLPEEIKMIKNNLPEPIKLDWNPEPVINLLDSEQFHKHYQKLASIREEQEQ